MALAGKEHVRTHFLMPRLLRDWLALFNRLLRQGYGRRSARHRRGGGVAAIGDRGTVGRWTPGES